MLSLIFFKKSNKFMPINYVKITKLCIILFIKFSFSKLQYITYSYLNIISNLTILYVCIYMI